MFAGAAALSPSWACQALLADWPSCPGQPVAASFTVQVRKADPLRREMAYRSAVHDWAKVSEGLLETARGYYPPGV